MVGQQKSGTETVATRRSMMLWSNGRSSDASVALFGSATLLRTLLLLVLVGLSGCTTLNHAGEQGERSPLAVSTPAAPDDRQPEGRAASSESDSETPDKADRIIAGDDSSSVLLPDIREPLSLYGDAVSMNFEEAPLADVVHSILGDTLNLDYIVEHPIRGQVTVRTRTPVPRDQLLPIIESLLLNNGAILVRGPNDRFFVSRAGASNTMVPRFDNAESKMQGYANIIVPLEHISASEMSQILTPVAPEAAFVRVDSKRNLLILAGTQLQLDGWLDIVATFDVDQLAGTSVGVFPVMRGEVSEVFQEVMHILETAEVDETSGLSTMVRVLPVERLNSILVVSPRAQYVEEVGGWINELDNISSGEMTDRDGVRPMRTGGLASGCICSTAAAATVTTSMGRLRMLSGTSIAAANAKGPEN